MSTRRLFDAVRSGTPVNNGKAMCHSSMLSILGEMVCCTGQQMTWEQVMNSELSFAAALRWDVEPPIKPEPTAATRQSCRVLRNSADGTTAPGTLA